MRGSSEPSLQGVGSRAVGHTVPQSPPRRSEDMVHVATSEATLAGRRVPEPLDTWQPWSPHHLEGRFWCCKKCGGMWVHASLLYACGPWPTRVTRRVAVQSRRTRGTLKPSPRVQSRGTRGDVRAYLGWKDGPRAAGHVVASECTLTGRQDLVLQKTWWCVSARPAPCPDLKLVRNGTWFTGY
jgi:hypothetical protein